MRSMLCLVEDQMKKSNRDPDAFIARTHDQALPDLLADLDPESPEAAFLRYVQSLSRADLAAMRREICLAGLAAIDRELAALAAG